MEKWFVINKGADFEKLGKEFGISPVTARLIRNREVIGEAAFERYLYGSLKDLRSTFIERCRSFDRYFKS